MFHMLPSSLVMGASITTAFRALTRAHVKELWRHSYGMGVGLRALVDKAGGIAPEEAFVLGLTVNMGQIILRSRSEELYEHVITEMQKPGAELAEAENVIMGVSHIDLGYLLARRWKLPELTVRVMLHHHEPEKAPPQFRKLSTLTYLVGVLTTALSVGSDGHVLPPCHSHVALAWT